MKSPYRPFAAAGCAIAGLLLSACPASRSPESDKVQVSTPAPKVEPGKPDYYQQCIAAPVPADFHWSAETIRAFCDDAFTPVIKFAEVRDLVEAGRGKDLDARFDALIKAYFEHELPEGALRNAYYNNFGGAGDETAQLIERWLASSPHSAHALAARGIHRVSRAEKARGTARSIDTPKDNFKRMNEQLELAQPDLMKAISANGRILAAYEALIDLARLGPEDDLGNWAMTHAAKVDPKNFYVRAAFSGMKTPSWGGSFEDMDDIADQAKPWIKNNPRLVNLRSLALTERGRSDWVDNKDAAALPVFEKGLAEGPVGRNLTSAAAMADRLGRYERAVELFSQVLRFDPYDSYCLVMRADANIDLQKYDAAKTDLDLLLAQNPDDAYGLRNYATMLLKQKKRKAAIPYLEHAYQLDANDEWSRRQLASAYLYAKRSFHEAEPLVAQMLEKNPQDGAAWLMRADLIQNLGGPGLRDAAENFVKYADPKDSEQAAALPKVKAWLAKQQPAG